MSTTTTLPRRLHQVFWVALIGALAGIGIGVLNRQARADLARSLWIAALQYL